MGFFILEPTAAPARHRTAPACTDCKLCKSVKPVFEPGLVPGKPLVVHSGTATVPQPVVNALRLAGLEPGECQYVGAIACATDKPTIAHANFCRPWFTRAVQAAQPTCIIPFGQVAISATIGWLWGEEAGMGSRWAGCHIPDQTLNAWVCPVMYGDSINKQVAELWTAQHARAAVRRLQTGKRPWATVPQWGKQVRRIYDPDEAAAVIAGIDASMPRMAAFDYEATGLKPEHPGQQLYSASIAWGTGPLPSHCISYPWQGAAIAATSKWLQGPTPKVAANMKFEERWTIRKLGHPVNNWYWCTQLAAHVEDPQEGVTGLKFQAYASLGYPLYNQHIEPYLNSEGPNELNRIHLLPLADLLQYGGLDALLEYALAWKQMKQNNYPLPPLPTGGAA